MFTQEGTSCLKNILETGAIFLQLAQPWFCLDLCVVWKYLEGAYQSQASVWFSERKEDQQLMSKPGKVTLTHAHTQKKCQIFGKTGEVVWYIAAQSLR